MSRRSFAVILAAVGMTLILSEPVFATSMIQFDMDACDDAHLAAINGPAQVVDGYTALGTTWLRSNTDWNPAKDASPIPGTTDLTLDVGYADAAGLTQSVNWGRQGTHSHADPNGYSFFTNGLFNSAYWMNLETADGVGQKLGARVQGFQPGDYRVYVIAIDNNASSQGMGTIATVQQIGIGVGSALTNQDCGGMSTGSAGLTAWTAGQNYVYQDVHVASTSDWITMTACMKVDAGLHAGSYFNGFQIVGVPEPSSLVVMATGLLGLICYAWRKRR